MIVAYETRDAAHDLTHFRARHPELFDRVHLLLDIYTRCQHDATEPLDLEKVFLHVYGVRACHFCQLAMSSQATTDSR